MTSMNAEEAARQNNAGEQVQQAIKIRKFLNSKQRCAIFIYLSQRVDVNRARLPPAVLKQAAAHFEVVSRTVRRIWGLGRKADANDPVAVTRALSPQKKKCGRKALPLPLDAISTIQPDVSPENEVKRMQHCIVCIILATIQLDPIFYGCYDVIHVDEKWFTITQEKARVITVPGEIIPQRTCRSKKFLQKLMFFCAIARP